MRRYWLQQRNIILMTLQVCVQIFAPFSLGPFHGAIAVPSVTRCRCRRGHRCAGGARQYRYRHLVNGREAARCGEWAQHFSNASCFHFIFVFYIICGRL